MNSQSALVYQFKISLEDIKPPIWRRIQVPANYSFWDLHVAIQDSMGWGDYHLHEFEFKNSETRTLLRIGIPDDDFNWSRETLAEWEIKISDHFTENNRSATYLYDFGDDWSHKIKLEKIENSMPLRRYPICLKGKRACPPEDVGGYGGYESFLNIIQNPSHDEYERMLEWVGGEYDPEKFVAEEVEFCDPEERWNTAFGEEIAG